MHPTFPRVRELLQAEVVKLGSVNKVSLNTGLTNNTIGKYLEGLSEPKQETLDKLSAYFKKPVAWLRGDSDDATTPQHTTTGLVNLSALSEGQREGWEMLLQLSPAKLAKALKAIELFVSDE